MKKLVLTVYEFSFCNFFLFLYFYRDRLHKGQKFDGILHGEDLQALSHFVGQKNLDNFLQLLIFPSREIQSLQKIKFEAFQLYETTLWNRYPLLNIGNQNMLIHRSVLKYSIRHFVYDFLKRNSVPFQTEIGERMEKYVLLGIQELEVVFLNEVQLKQKYNLQKVCDYLVEENVLVECKAIDISPIAGIKRTKEILQNEFDKTATKAYKQLLSTAHKLQSNQLLYGIVITYKETLIGYGVDAWEEFLNEPIAEFTESEKIELNALPPERVIFITLEDWDKLIQIKKRTQMKISEILDLGFKEFSNNQVLFLEQVLEKLSKEMELPTLSYLEKARPVFQKQ